ARRKLACICTCTGFVLMLVVLAVIGDYGAVGRRFFGRECWLIPETLRTRNKTLVETVINRVGYVKIEPAQAMYVGTLIDHIHQLTGPGESMLDVSDQGLLYFLSERPSASKFYFAAHCGPSRELQDEMIGAIVAGGTLPKCALRAGGTGPVDTPLFQFLRELY